MSKEEWKAVLDVHLQGTFEICHAGTTLVTGLADNYFSDISNDILV